MDEITFDSSTILITGGTGSFGKTLAKFLLEKFDNLAEVRILSRDEAKQDEMRRDFNSSRLKFYLGDTRDYRSVQDSMINVNYVFHAAALKQVPSCEFFPDQAINTNILGSQNVIESAFKNEVKSIVCLSTDKAVYPINAMGMTKALMEKTAISYSRKFSESPTKIAVTRYGNVLLSRGSVIPKFLEQVSKNQPITVTSLEMTRFLMSLKDSIDLVLHAFKHANSGDLFVQRAPAANMSNIIKGLLIALGRDNHPINVIGVRHGEKLHESLLGSEERARSFSDGDRYFRVSVDSRDLNYDNYHTQGDIGSVLEPYSSSNTIQLNSDEVANLLLKNAEFQSMVKLMQL